jgi:hypothetical protein
MVLGSLGLGIRSSAPLPQQQALYQERTSAEEGTSPQDLCGMINRRSQPLGLTFEIARSKHVEQLCSRLAGAVRKTGVGVPTLVFGRKHWVAVSAVACNRAGAARGFFVNDPFGGPGSATGEEHAEYDKCGQIGAYHGDPNMYITTAAWMARYWRVGDDYEAGGERFFVSASSGRAHLEVARGRKMAEPDGDDLTTKVGNAVMRGIEGHELTRCGPLAAQLIGATVRGRARVAKAADPLYYVIELARGDVIGRAAVDAATWGLIGVQAPSWTEYPFNSSEESLE